MRVEATITPLPHSMPTSTDRNFKHLRVKWSIVKQVALEQDVLRMSQPCASIVQA
jgi:DUF971 family protein